MNKMDDFMKKYILFFYDDTTWIVFKACLHEQNGLSLTDLHNTLKIKMGFIQTALDTLYTHKLLLFSKQKTWFVHRTHFYQNVRAHIYAIEKSICEKIEPGSYWCDTCKKIISIADLADQITYDTTEFYCPCNSAHVLTDMTPSQEVCNQVIVIRNAYTSSISN